MRDKKNYRDVDAENLDDIKGVAIAEVRVAKAADGQIQRVALIFEDGAVFAIDGRWPANAFLETAEADLENLGGAVFEDLSCRAFDPGAVVDTRYEQKVQIEVITNRQALKLDWVAVGFTDYDVDAVPRFEFRATPAWVAAPNP